MNVFKIMGTEEQLGIVAQALNNLGLSGKEISDFYHGPQPFFEVSLLANRWRHYCHPSNLPELRINWETCKAARIV